MFWYVLLGVVASLFLISVLLPTPPAEKMSGPRSALLIALEDLSLDRIDVLHAGRVTFPLAERTRAVAARRLWADIDPL